MRKLALAGAVASLFVGHVQAGQPFPSRQVTIVVPFAAGGPSGRHGAPRRPGSR